MPSGVAGAGFFVAQDVVGIGGGALQPFCRDRRNHNGRRIPWRRREIFFGFVEHFGGHDEGLGAGAGGDEDGGALDDVFINELGKLIGEGVIVVRGVGIAGDADLMEVDLGFDGRGPGRGLWQGRGRGWRRWRDGDGAAEIWPLRISAPGKAVRPERVEAIGVGQEMLPPGVMKGRGGAGRDEVAGDVEAGEAGHGEVGHEKLVDIGIKLGGFAVGQGGGFLIGEGFSQGEVVVIFEDGGAFLFDLIDGGGDAIEVGDVEIVSRTVQATVRKGARMPVTVMVPVSRGSILIFPERDR